MRFFSLSRNWLICLRTVTEKKRESKCLFPSNISSGAFISIRGTFICCSYGHKSNSSNVKWNISHPRRSRSQKCSFFRLKGLLFWQYDNIFIFFKIINCSLLFTSPCVLFSIWVSRRSFEIWNVSESLKWPIYKCQFCNSQFPPFFGLINTLQWYIYTRINLDN